MAKKVYAVRKGHQTGLFETWDKCKAAIDGFSGAEYKGFGNIEDANAYLNNKDTLENGIKSVSEIAASSEVVIAYVDGSYNNQTNKYAFGCVIVTPNRTIIRECESGEDPEAVAIRNVAGELQGSLHAAKWAIRNSFKRLEIRHDFEGTAKWVTGEWKARNTITKLYVEEMMKFKKVLQIDFKKIDAHTNDPLNDEADKLAKEALELGKRTKVQKGETWFTAEGISYKELETILELVEEEVDGVKSSVSDIAYGKRYELSIPKKEKIIIQHYSNKNSLTIQGSPQRLFSIMVTYITELVEFDTEKLPEIFNTSFNLNIDKDNVKKEFKGYLPNANGKLPAKLNRVLHQAVYNLNIFGDVFDATFLVEPALRALEGHLKLVLQTHGICLRANPTDKQDRFFMFEKNGRVFMLKDEYGGTIDVGLKLYFGKCYTFYHYKRHTLSHWDDPMCLEVDTTVLINNTNDAHQLIKSTLCLIDEYYQLVS